MDNLFCTGKERELADCHFDGWGHSDCEPSEAAGVICQDDQQEEQDEQEDSLTEKPIPERLKPKMARLETAEGFEVRLAGGRIPNEGRVEVGGNNSGGFFKGPKKPQTFCFECLSILRRPFFM